MLTGLIGLIILELVTTAYKDLPLDWLLSITVVPFSTILGDVE